MYSNPFGGLKMADEDIRNLLRAVLDYLVGLTPAITRKEVCQRGRKVHILIEFLIFSIHKNIESTQRYLYIDTELMRKVLLNETI